MSTGMLYHTRKKIRTRLKLLLHIIWANRRDHMVGDINPLSGMPSSLSVESRGSLEWTYIPRPTGNVMPRKIEDKKQKNMSA